MHGFSPPATGPRGPANRAYAPQHFQGYGQGGPTGAWSTGATGPPPTPSRGYGGGNPGPQPPWTHHPHPPYLNASGPPSVPSLTPYHHSRAPLGVECRPTSNSYHLGPTASFTQQKGLPESNGFFGETYRYAPIDIKHKTLSGSEIKGLFCVRCDNPMIFRVRLNPCYHFICLECFKEMQKIANVSCPVCGDTCEMGVALHVNEDLYVCSGACIKHAATTQTPNSSTPVVPPKGRAFLNLQSLLCHEMFFHGPEDIPADSADATGPAAVLKENAPETSCLNSPPHGTLMPTASSLNNMSEIGLDKPPECTLPGSSVHRNDHPTTSIRTPANPRDVIQETSTPFDCYLGTPQAAQDIGASEHHPPDFSLLHSTGPPPSLSAPPLHQQPSTHSRSEVAAPPSPSRVPDRYTSAHDLPPYAPQILSIPQYTLQKPTYSNNTPPTVESNCNTTTTNSTHFPSPYPAYTATSLPRDAEPPASQCFPAQPYALHTEPAGSAAVQWPNTSKAGAPVAPPSNSASGGSTGTYFNLAAVFAGLNPVTDDLDNIM